MRMDVLALAIQARPPSPSRVPPPTIEDEIHNPSIVRGDVVGAVILKLNAANDWTYLHCQPVIDKAMI